MGDIKLSEGDLNSTAGHRDLSGRSRAVRVNRLAAGQAAIHSPKARKAIKRALARRYGKAFRERKGYTATCLKTSASSWRCAVRWRYGQFVYKGKIKLALRSDGRIASKFVLRKTIP